MARPLIYQPAPWMPVEITMRCMQGRLLLRPGSEANRRILGVLGRAMELYAGHVELYFAGGTSNHLHILAAFDTAETKARWKAHVKCNISKELGRLYDWAGTHWDRRTRDIHILDDAAFLDRLAYLGRHGMKDGLVSSSDDWPGIQWVRAVMDGKPLKGIWYDRTALDAKHRAWARSPEGTRRPNLMDVATWKPVPLSTPPMWRGLDEASVRAKWRALMASAAERYPTKRPVLGTDAILAAHPHDRPRRSERSPAPPVHTFDRALRARWWAGYLAFVEAYRLAMERLRGGCAAACFPPEGCRPAYLRGAPGG